jgi:hypothetical protein
MPQKTLPTLGRLIHYTLSQQDADTINRRRSARAGRLKVDPQTIGNRVEAGDVYPATVTAVWPTSVNLQVTLDG